MSEGGRASIAGYSIINADDLDAACNSAKGCPLLKTGGTLEVYEAMPIG